MKYISKNKSWILFATIILQFILFACNTSGKSNGNKLEIVDSLSLVSQDGKTIINNVKKIIINNGSLVNEGNGVARITTEESQNLKVMIIGPYDRREKKFTGQIISVSAWKNYINALGETSWRSLPTTEDDVIYTPEDKTLYIGESYGKITYKILYLD